MKIPNIIKLPPNRVWRTYTGGKKLDELEGKASIEDSHFPEDWIASTTKAENKGRENFKDEGLSFVTLNNQSILLKTLMEDFPDAMLGKKHFDKYGANTQFLIKYLDSSVRLHIQAHPTIPFAQKYLNSNSGKTEAYVILNIRDEIKEPYIYLGFQNPISTEKFKDIIVNQEIDELLSCFKKIHVKKGDVFIVPGGLPHAIGEGVFMIEIMEPTDFVVRLEFERAGYLLPEEARFMGRTVDFAVSMIDFNSYSLNKIKQNYFCNPIKSNAQDGGEEYILIDNTKTKCFAVNKLKVNKNFTKKSDSFYVGIVTSGSGTIVSGSQHEQIKTGDRFLIPYQTEDVNYLTNNELEIVMAFPPE